MFGQKNSSGVRNPETVRSGTEKHPFCLDFRAGGIQTHQNSPNHHFGSNGGYWVCSCQKICWEFGTLQQYVRVPKNTRFASIFMDEVASVLVRKNLSGVPNPIIVCSSTETRLFCLDFRAGGNETHQNTHNHHFGSNGGYWVYS